MTSAIGGREDGWDRVLRYTVFGPLIGSYVFVTLKTPVEAMRFWNVAGAVFLLPLVGFPFAYLIGGFPAFIVGQLDRQMCMWGLKSLWRVSAVGTAGFAVAAAFLNLLAMGFAHKPYSWCFGLIGATPAVCCCVWCNHYLPDIKSTR